MEIAKIVYIRRAFWLDLTGEDILAFERIDSILLCITLVIYS